MKCIICNSLSNLFLEKDNFKDEYSPILKNFKKFEYYKCIECGFTISKTHIDMTNQEWLNLNHDFHHFIENNVAPINQPPYLEQATILNILNFNNIITFENSIDFAGGYGTLSNLLFKYYNINLNKK